MGMNEGDTTAFFKAGGAELMFAMFDARDRRKEEEAAYDRARREFTVKVKFPDGSREVPAHMAQDDLYGRSEMTTFRPTPDDMEGWCFVGVMGGDVEWHALQEVRRYEPEPTHYYMPDEYGFRGEYR